jgi:hypothetical protein
MSEGRAMEHQYPPRPASGTDSARQSRSKASFRGHFTTYLLVGAFLFTLNVLTSFGDWWFYWPLFFWGWGIIAHYVAAYGFPGPERLSSLGSLNLPNLPAPARKSSPSASFAAGEFAELHQRIERLRSIAATLPEGATRIQAEAIVSRANDIAAVLAADRASADMVRSFSNGFLQPSVEVLSHYSRLTGRNVPGAGEVLRSVEEESLPQIQQHLDRLYEHLHHRDLIQLSVANDMADFDLTQAQREISAELDKIRA